MGKTMKADSPSPRFHGVTPCSPGLITFGLKSLICCWKAVDGAIPDKIFPRSFLPSRWKTFKKIILSRGKIGGRRVSIPTSRHFKINPPRNNYYFFLFFFLLNLINDRIFPLELAFRCLTSKMTSLFPRSSWEYIFCNSLQSRFKCMRIGIIKAIICINSVCVSRKTKLAPSSEEGSI